MNSIEENLQKYQLIQENIIYILSTSLIGVNLKLSCYKFEGNNNPDVVYSSIFTIEQLKKADPIFQIANDCEDVQWIFEEVILAKSVGILEYNGFLDVYFYMRVSGRKAKVILRLNGTQTPKMVIPSYQKMNSSNIEMNNKIRMNNNFKMNNNIEINNNIGMNNNIGVNNNIEMNYNNLEMNNNINYNKDLSYNNSITNNNIINYNNSYNNSYLTNDNMANTNYSNSQERLSKLQYDTTQIINEQNALRKQISMFFGEDNDIKDNHERSRSTNQNNKYHNNLINYNNISNQVNNISINNLKRVQINDDEDNDIYEVPPMNFD